MTVAFVCFRFLMCDLSIEVMFLYSFVMNPPPPEDDNSLSKHMQGSSIYIIHALYLVHRLVVMKIINLCSFITVRDHVSQPQRIVFHLPALLALQKIDETLTVLKAVNRNNFQNYFISTVAATYILNVFPLLRSSTKLIITDKPVKQPNLGSQLYLCSLSRKYRADVVSWVITLFIMCPFLTIIYLRYTMQTHQN